MREEKGGLRRCERGERRIEERGGEKRRAERGEKRRAERGERNAPRGAQTRCPHLRGRRRLRSLGLDIRSRPPEQGTGLLLEDGRCGRCLHAERRVN